MEDIMIFKEWADKYYPMEDKETLHKMSHAWAAGHINMLSNRSEKKLPLLCRLSLPKYVLQAMWEY
jgi:hypothetical protein